MDHGRTFSPRRMHIPAVTRMQHFVTLAAFLFAATLSGAEEPPDDHWATSDGYVETVDGVRLCYHVEGSSPDTIVVIHGGPGFHLRYIAPDLGMLARAHTVIYYDQRGAGRSTVVTDSTQLTLEAHIADLEAIRKHFDLDRMVLLGHSWGAALGAHYALQHPAQVAKLILVDSMPPRRTPYGEQMWNNLRAWMDSTTQADVEALSAARRNATNPGEACRNYWRVFMRGYLADPADTTLLSRMRGDVCDAPDSALKNASFVTRSTLGPLGDWDWRDAFHKTQVPVLIIHGAKDPIPVASASEWQAAFPMAELVVLEHAGHFSYLEQPDEFMKAIEAFLR